MLVANTPTAALLTDPFCANNIRHQWYCACILPVTEMADHFKAAAAAWPCALDVVMPTLGAAAASYKGQLLARDIAQQQQVLDAGLQQMKQLLASLKNDRTGGRGAAAELWHCITFNLDAVRKAAPYRCVPRGATMQQLHGSRALPRGCSSCSRRWRCGAQVTAAAWTGPARLHVCVVSFQPSTCSST